MNYAQSNKDVKLEWEGGGGKLKFLLSRDFNKIYFTKVNGSLRLVKDELN